LGLLLNVAVMAAAVAAEVVAAVAVAVVEAAAVVAVAETSNTAKITFYFKSHCIQYEIFLYILK